MDLTRGRGADVIYDGVGRDSFPHSVAALAVHGHLVSYGQALRRHRPVRHRLPRREVGQGVEAQLRPLHGHPGEGRRDHRAPLRHPGAPRPAPRDRRSLPAPGSRRRPPRPRSRRDGPAPPSSSPNRRPPHPGPRPARRGRSSHSPHSVAFPPEQHIRGQVRPPYPPRRATRRKRFGCRAFELFRRPTPWRTQTIDSQETRSSGASAKMFANSSQCSCCRFISHQTLGWLLP